MEIYLRNLNRNYLTIDCEEIYHAEIFKKSESFEILKFEDKFLEKNFDIILATLEKHNVVATFFILGEIAKKYRTVINEIKSLGHDIGSHGYSHIMLTELDKKKAWIEVKKSKDVIEDVISKEVVIFRAPTFSIGKENQHIFKMLLDAGYLIDSSVNNYNGNSMYATSDYPSEPFMFDIGGRKLLEVPVFPSRWGAREFAFSGGGYFRLIPFFIFRQLAKHTYNRSGGFFNFYAHPWEFGIDEYSKYINFSELDWKSRFRLTVNIGKMEGKFNKLCSRYKFGLLSEFLSKSELDSLPVVHLEG